MERRSLIEVLDNPELRLDYLAVLGHDIDVELIGSVAIALRYVPDRFTITAASWRRYLEALTASPAPSLETLSATLLSDVNDVVIARWMEVSMFVNDHGGGNHAVVISDHQPGWQNTDLLDRLAPLGIAQSWN